MKNRFMTAFSAVLMAVSAAMATPASAQQTPPTTTGTNTNSTFGTLAPGNSVTPNMAVTPLNGENPVQSAPMLRAIAGEKRRVAVIPFEFGNIKHWWGNDEWDIGRDLADLLKTGLVREGTFALLERTMLDQVIGEQAINQSGMVDPRTAIQAGRLLGVNAIIVGNITQFGFDERGTNGFLGINRSRQIRATVAVNARIIDPNTGEVLAAVSARGEGQGRGRDTGGKTSQGGINMSKCTFENTYMTEAVSRCVQQLVTELVKAAPRIAIVRQELRGKVADYDGMGTVVFNFGLDQGVQKGDVISVERVVRQIRDPDTNRVIRDVSERIGTVKITKVDNLSACGRFEPLVPSSSPPHLGDIAVRMP
jgi:curli biogenesis system outer membrane secretion channel CsgG